MEGSGGYRTRQRELIEQFLVANRERHLSVDEVEDYLRGQGSPVGRSTVYRCLDRLVVQGAVRQVLFGRRRGGLLPVCRGRHSLREHFHLKCIGCGRLIHVECDYLDEVARHVLEHHHFTIDNTKTVLYGFCESCAQKA